MKRDKYVWGGGKGKMGERGSPIGGRRLDPEKGKTHRGRALE